MTKCYTMNIVHTEVTLARRKIGPNFKDDLLKIARKVLEEEGLEGLEIRKLAKAADCSVGTFYNHYKSLDELIIHINGETVDILKNLMFKDIHTDDIAKEIIRKICIGYITYAQEHYAEWLLLFEYPIKMSLPAWYQEKVDSLFEKAAMTFYPILRGPKKDTERAVKILWCSLHGISSLTLKDKLRFSTEQDTLELCQELAHNYILGYRIGLGVT